MSSDVVYPWAEVLVNGRSVGVHPVTISAAIADDLPGRLNFGSGITQRTGVIRWDRVIGKDGLLLSPYRRTTDDGFTLPSPMDRIVVRMGVQDTDPRTNGLQNSQTVFTGKVDYSEVAHDGYPVTHVVDDIDKLNRVIRFDPYKHHMPPLVSQTGRYRHTGLLPDTILAWIAQRCGFYSTVQPRGSAYVSAMLHGSTIPSNRWGEVIYSHRTYTDQTGLPEWDYAPPGKALARGIVDWQSGSVTARPKIIFSAKLGANHGNAATLQATVAGGAMFGVDISANRTITPRIGGTTYPELALVVPANTYFSVCFDSAGTLTATVESGSKSTGIASWTPVAVTWANLNASLGGCSISGLNICGVTATDSGVLGVGFTQTAIIDAGYPYPLHLSRSIRDEKAIDVLKEICEAICLTCYLDGEGRLNITYGRTIHQKPAVGSLDVKDSVRSFSVKDDSLLAARQVVVKYKTIEGDFTNKAEGSYVTLWQGGDTQLDADELKEDIIGPAEDEEWFEVDTAWSYANGSDEEKARFNRKNGSFYGFTTTSGTPGSKSEWWSGGSASISKIVPWRWKVTQQPTGASSTHIPEVTTVNSSLWGKGMPIVRGGAYAKLVDAEPYTATGGSDTAADLLHDAGSWATDTRAEDIAEYAMNKSKKALPVVENLECFFDPRIKIGDKWNLDLTSLVGVRLECFILGVEHDPANDTTRVNMRVLWNLTSWVWDSLPENYRTFDAVTGDFTNFDALKVGK